MRASKTLSLRFAALALTACVAVVDTASAQDNARTYRIAEQSLDQALREFALASNLDLLFSPALVAGKKSASLDGEFTVDEGLRTLLRGSGLEFSVSGSRVVISEAKAGAARQAVAPATSATNGASGYTRLAQAETGALQSPSTARNSADSRLEVEEVVVTAQKRRDRQQDVPIPVSVLSGQSLAQDGLVRLEDYYKRIPGLGLTLSGDAGRPVLVIRGISTGGDSNPTVGLVVDEIAYGTSTSNFPSRASFPDIDPGDVAQLEVLRGPQGTLYGASSMGGLLKYVTIDPDPTSLSGRIEMGATSVSHSDDTGYKVRGALNLPLTDTAAIRASAFSISDPGYIDNVRTGAKDVDGRTSDGGRLSLLWAPNDDFSMKLGAMIQHSERDALNAVSTSLSGTSQDELNDTGFYIRDARVFGLTLSGQIGDVALVSAAGYSEDESDSRLDNQGLVPILPLLGIDGVQAEAQPLNQSISKFTQEFRATIPLSSRIEWLLGAFYAHERNKARYDFFPADPTTGAANAPQILSIRDATTYDEYAAFTNLTFAFNDAFDVQFGARMSHNRLENSSTKTGPLSFLFSPPIVSGQVAEDDAFTYLVTPRYRVSEDLMLYARVASGFRPGGPNTNCTLNAAAPCEYSSDSTVNYEMGLKGELWDGRFTFDGSIYHIDWQDIQLTNSVPDPNLGSVVFVDNIAEARSQGVELSLGVRPWTGAHLAGWIAWNDAEISKDPPPSSGFGGARGDQLPYSSPVSWSVTFDQRFSVGTETVASIGAAVTFVDDRIGAFQGPTPRVEMPSYEQVDLHAALEHGTWTLSAFLNNLTDERGVLRSGLDALRPDLVTYMQPRTVGLSLGKSF